MKPSFPLSDANPSGASGASSASSWVPCYSNDIDLNLSSPLDNVSFGDNFPLRHHSTFSSNAPKSLFGGISPQNLLPETNLTNLQEQFFQATPVSYSLLMYQSANCSLLQDVSRDSFFNGAGFDETDLSCESSSFDVFVNCSLVLTVNDSRQGPMVPEFSQVGNIEVESDLASCISPPSGAGSKVKKYKRKHIKNRSRLGCWICRIKHLKCDESKPTCNKCFRFGIECDYSEERPGYVSDQNLRRQKLDAIITKKRFRIINPAVLSRDTSVDKRQSMVRSSQEQQPFLKQEWMMFFCRHLKPFE